MTLQKLVKQIHAKIQTIEENRSEYDGDPDLYELYFHNTQIEIDTLHDVLYAIASGEFE